MNYTRNSLTLDTAGYEQALMRLLRVEKDAKNVVEEAMKTIGDFIREDTKKAVEAQNLPAKGRYSSGDTSKSIIAVSRVEWNGGVGSMPIGFDFEKPGAGGFLISGTPTMKPDQQVRKIYKSKKYMREKQELLGQMLYDFIDEAGGF